MGEGLGSSLFEHETWFRMSSGGRLLDVIGLVGGDPNVRNLWKVPEKNHTTG